MPPAATIADFGSGVSPILADGVVVLVRDEMKDPKIIALDAATGEVKWEKKRQSPVRLRHAGRVGHAGGQAGRGAPGTGG